MEILSVAQIRIGDNKPGAPVFTMNISFGEGGSVIGSGRVTQAVNPPLAIPTYLSGRYSLIVWGADTEEIITLTGHEFHTPMPPNPVNAECTMRIDSKSRETGVATYRYLDGNGKWVELKSVPLVVTWTKPIK